MRGAGTVPLLLIALVLVLALLVPAVSADNSDTTTTVHVVKVASDGSTIGEETVDYRWLEQNLPVRGDGSTHYYHQGPTNDPNDIWDPAESKSFQDDDMGALKGTAVRDICGLVGGMSPGDTLKVVAADGYPSKPFSYGTVYQPTARQGPMVLTWYRGEDGNVPAYWSGMKIVFFADTSTNAQGLHVFGVSDMRASMQESEWGYKYDNVNKVSYPTTTALAIRYVKELRILSTMKPTTKTPTPTAKPTGTATVTVTSKPGGTGIPTTTTGVPFTTAPAVTTLWPDNDGGVMTYTTVPPDGSGPVVVTTTPSPTVTVPGTTGGANTTGNATGVPSPTANATANQTANLTPNATPSAAPVSDERTYDYSVSTGFDYSVLDEATEMPTTATPTPTATAIPNPTATAATLSAAPTPAPTATPSTAAPSVTGSPAGRSFNRSVSFSFSVNVRENGDPALAPTGSLEGFVLAFLRAFEYIAGAFIPN